MRYGADDWGSEDEYEDDNEEHNIPKINYQLFLGIILGIFIGKQIF